MVIDFETLSAKQAYYTMIQAIVPRPIAWVLTENESGSHNLAPFSFFTGVSSDPPLLMFSVGKKSLEGDDKDTVRNIKKNNRFVVHVASTGRAKEVSISGNALPYGDSEITEAGLNTVKFEGFSLPRLQDVDLAMGCELFELNEIGNKPMTLVFGLIKCVYIADDMAKFDGGKLFINNEKFDPLARLGDDDYAGLKNSFNVE